MLTYFYSILYAVSYTHLDVYKRQTKNMYTLNIVITVSADPFYYRYRVGEKGKAAY